MDRRRMAIVLGGLVLVGGAVAALRLAGGPPHLSGSPPPPPPPTVVKPYHAEGVLPPSPGARPAAPARLVLTPGPRRLQVAWGSALPGGQDPRGAAGYDVRWGVGDRLDQEKLVTEPATELEGLPPGQDTRVQVTSVDAFGQRSGPATATGRARGNGADAGLVDHFDGAQVPDPRRWRLASTSTCAQATKGSGADAERMIVLSDCGRSSVTLRSRALFQLGAASGAELGRVSIDTDAPGEDGELDVDLVPGPVAMIDNSPNDPFASTAPNTAAIDGMLPPGTIRVRIAANRDTGQPVEAVQVAAGPNTPVVAPSTEPGHPLPRPRIGLSHRWDVVLRTDGVRVLRDGVDVGGGNVVPEWHQASALFEFTGPVTGQQRVGVSMIGLGGAPTTPPPLVDGPALRPVTFVEPEPGVAAKAGPVDTAAGGPGGGELRMAVVAKPNTPSAPLVVNGAPPAFALRFGDRVFPAVPAVPGTPLLPEVLYPLVAPVPADALAGAVDPGAVLTLHLSVDIPANYPAQIDLAGADLELRPGGHLPVAVSSPGAASAVYPLPPELARLTARVLDASGQPLAAGQKLPRGRVVLDVSMDPDGAGMTNNGLAGLAGFEVWLDNVELVAVPTATDGPGIGGDWRVAFDPADAASGMHTLDVRTFGADRGVPFGETFVVFDLGP